jgi:hypothetical protein
MIYTHEINLNLLQRKPNFGDHLYLNECQLLYVLFFNCLLVLFSLILPPYPAQECGDYVHTLPKNAEIMSIPCPRMRRLCPYPAQECGDYIKCFSGSYVSYILVLKQRKVPWSSVLRLR